MQNTRISIISARRFELQLVIRRANSQLTVFVVWRLDCAQRNVATLVFAVRLLHCWHWLIVIVRRDDNYSDNIKLILKTQILSQNIYHQSLCCSVVLLNHHDHDDAAHRRRQRRSRSTTQRHQQCHHRESLCFHTKKMLTIKFEKKTCYFEIT